MKIIILNNDVALERDCDSDLCGFELLQPN